MADSCPVTLGPGCLGFTCMTCWRRVGSHADIAAGRRLYPGARYLERGQPVTILARRGKGGGPRNVLIARQDGLRVVRPFRGLRRIKEAGDG